MRVAWCGKGEKVITCSHDQTVAVHEVSTQDQAGSRTAALTTVKRVCSAAMLGRSYAACCAAMCLLDLANVEMPCLAPVPQHAVHVTVEV